MIELISEDEFISKAENVPLHYLQWTLAKRKDIEVLVRRDDLIDKDLSGNKFYKLFYNFKAAKENGATQLLSFGGAYSNHLYALATAAKTYGFKAIGVIRGERPTQLSPTLKDAEAWGMRLHFISRVDYRDRCSAELREELKKIYGDFFEVPEGGANLYGVKGAKVLGMALGRQLNSDYTAICLPCGTASTLAGVAAGLPHSRHMNSLPGKVLGFSVLKESITSDKSLGRQISVHQKLINEETSNWRLISGFHGGGYGKKLPPDMYSFMREFEYECDLQLDPVYTLKMCWGVKQLMEKNYWPRGSRLILIHTGGLQGRRGFAL